LYIPGQIQPTTVQLTKWQLLSGTQNRERPMKRNLEGDEYNYYYSYLADEKTADYVKAAIAIVLDADLKLLYKSYYSRFQDPVLEKWKNVFLNDLSETDKNKARAEMQAFDNYLYTNIPISEYSDKARSTRQDFIISLTREESEKDKAKRMLEQIEEERGVVVSKEEQEETARKVKIARDTTTKYIIDNIRKYLITIFYSHQVSIMMDKKISNLEYYVRMLAINSITSKKVPPHYGLNAYRVALDMLAKNPLSITFKAKVNSMFNKYQHPFTEKKKELYA